MFVSFYAASTTDIDADIAAIDFDAIFSAATIACYFHAAAYADVIDATVSLF